MKTFKTLLIMVTSLFLLQACNDDDNHAPQIVEQPPEQKTTIVDAAVANGNFTTLVVALQATGLDQTLADTNSKFTVFAPTDEAFALLGQSTIDAAAAIGSASSTCNDACATVWPPVIVDDSAVDNLPGLSLITRDDNTMQAAYNGRPLYFYANDTAAGSVMGDGVNDMWWKVALPQVSLQIQGSNVTATDIYTTNGVIHVIDTVITTSAN